MKNVKNAKIRKTKVLKLNYTVENFLLRKLRFTRN